jgi:1-acyl-sn-glycerol-3-phosphate acyltransferase
VTQRSLCSRRGPRYTPPAVSGASARNWLLSLLIQLGSVVWHVWCHAIALVLWVLPPFWDGKHYFYLAHRAWAPGLLWLSHSPVTFVGRNRVDWSKPHVVVANHQGNADIPLLMALVPKPLRFLAKRSVGWLPILGWMLHLARFPFVDRGSGRRSRDSLDRIARRMQAEKLLVAIFPEGTRSPEGTLLPFKLGAFQLAIQAQVPIVPVVIEGSGIVMARRAFRILPTRLTVTVGEPISTEGLTVSDRHELAARVEGEMARALGWRRISSADLPRERAADVVRRRARLEQPERTAEQPEPAVAGGE